MFLLSARISGLWDGARPCSASRLSVPAGNPARTHMICALRLLLLVPVVACVVAAWLAATALALIWAVLAAPLRHGGGSTAD